MTQWCLFPECDWLSMGTAISAIPSIHSLRKKNHVIVSINVEKALDKIQHPFTIKSLSKLETEQNLN